MDIIPSIDLKDGRCVRLKQGRWDAVTTYADSPNAVAERIVSEGGKYLHLVDLDGAKTGQRQHLSTWMQIKQQTGLKIQVGGGIRSITDVDQILSAGQTLSVDQESFVEQRSPMRQVLSVEKGESAKHSLSLGIDRVVLGTLAMTDRSSTLACLNRYGTQKIVLALDVDIDVDGVPWLVSHAWEQRQPVTLWALLDHYLEKLIQLSNQRHPLTVLCTDIRQDGMLAGANIPFYESCVSRYPGFQVAFQASGGISDVAELKILAEIGIAGAVIGKALYEKKFTLQAAIAAAASVVVSSSVAPHTSKATT